MLGTQSSIRECLPVTTTFLSLPCCLRDCLTLLSPDLDFLRWRGLAMVVGVLLDEWCVYVVFEGAHTIAASSSISKASHSVVALSLA